MNRNLLGRIIVNLYIVNELYLLACLLITGFCKGLAKNLQLPIIFS